MPFNPRFGKANGSITVERMERVLSRRAILAAGLAAGAACTRRDAGHRSEIRLRLSTWGEPVELAAFQSIIQRYERLHPGIVIDLEQIGYRSRTEVDTLIAAGVGPDLFRVQYLDVGRYSPSGALIDLSQYLPPGFGDQFTAPTWTAVRYKDRPHALPHHTDTSAILYNKTAFHRLGIKVPAHIDESWTWEEFVEVSRVLKKKAFEFAFAVNWNHGGSFRWLNFLFQHGGTLLKDNFSESAIPSADAVETLKWTQSFFREGLVPMSDSAVSSEQIENLFATGVLGMYFDVGPQSIRELKTDFEWAATYLPRGRYLAAELGGNAIGISRNTPHPDIAADFALFLTNEENMRDFVIGAEFLPVRKRLLEERLPYDYRPDEMQVHIEQSKTVPVALARTVTLPSFPRINRVLGNELDLAFTGGQSAEKTIEHIARAVSRASRV